MPAPLILYVPGLLPKPEYRVHRKALLRCLVAGLSRIDSSVANAVESSPDGFDIVAWTHDFYEVHRDIELDSSGINAVVQQLEASDRDITEATSWSRRLTRWVYRLGDLLPFLIPHLASERMEVHLRDLMRYERNTKGIAERIRDRLKAPLLAAASAERPVLLIGHSMGSVIAYDALWELSHKHSNTPRIDLFLTMGSPLGQRFMQKKLAGNNADGRQRYPTNIGRWGNLAAVGDLTAIDPQLANDYGEMVELGLVDSIDDEVLFNFFRLDGELNVHSEYGYLVNRTTALIIANWWRRHESPA